MEPERFYLTDTPLFFGIHAIAYVLSVGLASLTTAFAAYQILTLYMPYVLTRLSGNSFKFPEYFYRVYGDDVADLGIEHWGYLVSALAVSLATFKFVLPDSPFKAADDSAKFLSGTQAFFETARRKFDALARVAKRLVDVVAEEAKKID